MKRALPLLLLALAGPVSATNRLPLVLNNGMTQQIQPGDTLQVPNLNDTGLTVSEGVCTDNVKTLISCILGLPSIASGHILGNSSASTAVAGDTTLTAIIDRAIGSVQGDVLYRNASVWVVLAPGASGQCLQTQGSAANPVWGSCGAGSNNQKIRSITFVISGAALTPGVAGFLEIPFACTINRVTLLANQTGSAVIDIWKAAYVLNTPPTITNTITASDLPTLTSAQSYQDSTLTGWTTAVNAGDIVAYNVNSVSTITQLTVSMKCTAS